jgi:molecular chaperone GrpE
VSAIDPAGQAFDPHQHESLSQQPHPEVPEGNVVQVIRKGYKLNTRLLRPASVMVSSGPVAAGDQG